MPLGASESAAEGIPTYEAADRLKRLEMESKMQRSPHRKAFGKHRLEQAKKIFEGLQQGKIDRSLFTDNANGYFSEQALEDFKNSLGSLGKWESCTQVGQSLRGGMVGRTYIVRFANKTIRAWTYEMPDGKLEQFQAAVVN